MDNRSKFSTNGLKMYGTSYMIDSNACVQAYVEVHTSFKMFDGPSITYCLSISIFVFLLFSDSIYCKQYELLPGT